jgi:hypothetical protein
LIAERLLIGDHARVAKLSDLPYLVRNVAPRIKSLVRCKIGLTRSVMRRERSLDCVTQLFKLLALPTES